MGLSEPIAGVYEKLITQDVRAELERFEAAGWKAVDAEVSSESAPHVLARYIGEAVGQRLAEIPAGERVKAANRILAALATTSAADPADVEAAGPIVEGPRQLLTLARQEAPGVYA